MNFNWKLFLDILSPIVAAFGGALISRYLKEKPYLMTYISHTSAIYSKTLDGKELKVHTHSIVIQNNGRKPSKNVRIGHNINYFPSFSVHQSKEYDVINLPDGSKEIHFPIITPKERIFINYLYFPPIVWNQINTYIKSDDGPAKIVNMQLTPIYPKYILILMSIPFIIGLVFIVYFFIQFVIKII
jgi:hypothetical protein